MSVLPAVTAVNGRNIAYRQSAILWPPGVPDGLGGIADGEPRFVQVRWEDRNVISLDAAGQEFTSLAVIYVGASIEAPGGFIARTVDGEIETRADLDAALGDPGMPDADPAVAPTDPDPEFVALLARTRARAREIRALNVSPNLNATAALYKAII